MTFTARRRPRIIFCLLALAYALTSAGSRRATAFGAGQAQGPGADWVFISESPETGGPALQRAAQEELWLDAAGHGTWRRISGRDVLFAADVTSVPSDLLARLKSAAARPPVYRPRGDRTKVADGRVGPYLRVAAGTSERFLQWGDDVEFLDPALVSAARALLAAARPTTPVPPGPNYFCLQALPLDERLVTILDKQIATITPDIVATNPALARVTAFPFAWVPLPAGQFALTERIVLNPRNPVAAIRVGGRVLQVVIQQTDPDRERQR